MAHRRNKKDPFALDPDGHHLNRERAKARELRTSQWWKRQCARGRCHYCHRSTPAGALTMDHIVPLVRGGRTTKGNVVPACKACNSAKKHLLPMEWEAYLADFGENET
ncbi:MAG: HNH endonuclease [Desulfobacterales bacterium]|jgi:5-methylcytosine-specific restriction endonuclease McrA